jgi:hypothetical protein
MTKRHDPLSEFEKNAPEWFDKLRELPSEYFRENWYATFWFETDFPHPTCLYPSPVEIVSEKVASLRPESQRNIMGGERRRALPRVAGRLIGE